MVRSRYGAWYIPSQGTSIVGAIFIVGFGLFWAFTAASMGAPGFFPLFGILFIIVGVVISVSLYNKTSAYKEAEQQYQKRRNEISSRRTRRQ